jgi:glucose/arabinose dehydrogenase
MTKRPLPIWLLSLGTVAVVGAASAALAQTPQIVLQQIATASSPVAMTHAGDGSGRLFVVQQTGQIRVWDGSTLLGTPFLDIDPIVNTNGEMGLLGLAFHPQYETNGYFFVHYNNASADTVIARYRVSSGNPNVADPTSGIVVLNVDQPAGRENHKGGQIKFGPDNFLYIALGDGGSGGDPDNLAQNINSPLGKILRIAPDVASANPTPPYTVPGTNPFVGVAGLDEIWSYGLRNPWKFSFDRQTGDMFIGDVGQGNLEEIDFEPAGVGGRNYGWRLMEGTACFNPSSNCNPGGLILPILEYPNLNAPECAVTGGYRYRGPLLAQLSGWYLYADYCTGRIWGGSFSGASWSSTELLDTSINIATFGEDEAGELYVAGSGAVHRITGPNVRTLSVNNATVGEVAANASFTVTLSQSSASTVTVNYATANGTAIAGSDYSSVTTTQLQFPPGTVTRQVDVPILQDAFDEASETFFLRLSSPVGATLADAEGLGTITDDDPAPNVSVNDVVTVEGNSGNTPAVFTLTLSAQSGQAVVVPYATANDTALAGSDYVAASGSVTFPAGTTTRTVSVSVRGDTVDEPSEAYLLNLATPTNATLGDAVGQGTIADDDGRPALCQPIVTLPYTITGQGRYCFVRNLSTNQTTGAAITIDSDFVVLDLKGFKLGGGGAGLGTQATGVLALERRNVTVRNGNIRGFHRAVFLDDQTVDASASQGHVVEGLRLDENTFAALEIHGTGNIIRGNQVVTTGGTTSSGPNVDIYGVRSRGPGMRVLGNDVSDTVGVGTGSGIAIDLLATAAVVERNRLANDAAPTASFGIRVAGTDIQVVNNRMSLFGSGVFFVGGNGKYRDNVTSGVGTPYTGGTDAGNNQ